MPELPEVQTTVNGIREHVVGLKIVDVWTDYDSPYYYGKDEIKNPAFFRKFKKLVTGAKITGSSRRAKNVLIHLSNQHTIIIHMKMTGHIMQGKYIFNKKAKYSNGEKINLQWVPVDSPLLEDPFNRFIHLTFKLSNGKYLVLCDTRKFAKVTIVSDAEILNEKNRHLGGLGHEPLDSTFTLNIFKEKLNLKSTGKIKTVLMDQTLIAGIGNIYSDEVLWRANVHPETVVRNIPDENIKKMYAAIGETLKKGIDFGGDSMSDYRNINGDRGKFQEHHQAYRKTGSVCLKKGCGGTILRKVVGGRSAHFCSKHQILFTSKN
jgi:formamidopyrimidine-DNA glycosylase